MTVTRAALASILAAIPAVCRPFRTPAGAAVASTALLTGCGMMGLNFRSEATQNLSVAAAGELHVTNNVGSVRVMGDPAAKNISAIATRIGKGATQGDADDALKECSATLEVDQASGKATAVGKGHDSMNRQCEVKWEFIVPPSTRVFIENHVGDISLSGLASTATIHNEVGKIAGESLSGGGVFHTQVGDIDVATQAPVDMHADTGKVAAKLAPGGSGDILMSADVGNISLALPADWSGALTAQSDVGHVTCEAAHASVTSGGNSTTGKKLSATIGSNGSAKAKLSSNVGSVNIQDAATAKQ